MKTVDTFTAIIYVGFLETDAPYTLHTLDECRDICQEYVDKLGLCVTVTPTEYIYTHGREYGAAIGLINYPRFPDSEENIREKALRLARLLLGAFHQYKVSVVFSDETVMLEAE